MRDDDHLDDSDLPQYRIVTEAGGILMGWRRESPPEPRLHVQALSGPDELVVYLEVRGGGRRAWEVAAGISALADATRADVELDRPTIEAQWLADALTWGRLGIRLVEGPWLHLTVYAGEPTEFQRRLHLRRDLGLLRPPSDRADAYSIVAAPVPSILVGEGVPEQRWVRVPLRADWIWR